jgi:hypothetical protein
MSAALRVADAIRDGWDSYNRANRLPPHIVKAVEQLLRCRTAALGGHVHRCDRCGSEVPLYNSCGSRHCPSCQTGAKETWLDARLAEVLPAQYFHIVFTLPHALNALIDANRTLLLGELFGVVNWVLQRFARDPRWRLEGELGFLAILHTWTQRLGRHFHVHCIVPGGVWRSDEGRWKPCRGPWLFRKESLGLAFRNRYLRRLGALRKRGRLRCEGPAAGLADEAEWETLLARLGNETWIVYPKATPRDPTRALDYVARYTHKVAIGDHRIRAVESGRVTYAWRDRAAGNVEKTDTIPAEEFVRRFVAHILPEGFHKIRYFGWMAAQSRKAVLAAIRRSLGVEPPPVPEPESLAERILRKTGVDIARCPHCGQGRMQRTGAILLPARGPPP